MINGPPRSGKDTFGEFCLTQENVEIIKFAEPLHAAARASVPPRELEYYAYTHKEEVIPSLGISYRQLCIEISENFYKPTFGIDVFGRIAASTMSGLGKGYTWVITDSGFAYEAKPVIDLVGASNCTLIRLHRHGCSYKNDSRSYINLNEFGVATIDLENKDIKKFEKDALALLKEFG
jgi:hypothetical protein